MQDSMGVPERKHTIPCEHCGGDHAEFTCVWKMDNWLPYCPHCGDVLIYDRNCVGWCRDHGAVVT